MCIKPCRVSLKDTSGIKCVPCRNDFVFKESYKGTETQPSCIALTSIARL